MNKGIHKWIIIILVLLQFCCAGCSEDTLNVDRSNVESTSTQDGISVEEAKEKIEAQMPTKPYPVYVEFQSEQTIQERTYYYFLAYTLSEKPIQSDEGSYYQQFTYAWIYVDIQTGDLYEMPPSGEGLIPWQQDGST